MKMMKYLAFSLFFFSGCQDAAPDCYKIESEEACLRKPGCEYKRADLVFMLDGVALMPAESLFAAWNPPYNAHQPEQGNAELRYSAGFCFIKKKKKTSGGQDNYNPCDPYIVGECILSSEDFYCLPLGKYMYLTYNFMGYSKSLIPSEWKLCTDLGLPYDAIEFPLGAQYLSPEWEPPVCGNGIIELGEQCDGDQLGSMADCAEHAALIGDAQYTAGELGCSRKCAWDFSGCVSVE
jgi:hypothetical protein